MAMKFEYKLLAILTMLGVGFCLWQLIANHTAEVGMFFISLFLGVLAYALRTSTHQQSDHRAE